MTSRNALSLNRNFRENPPIRSIDSSTPLLRVIPQLLDAPDRRLGVLDGSENIGIIDESSLLEALGRQIAPRFDCSIIEILCPSADYSASIIARAVEDADVHLVDLLSNPDQNGHVRVTLRVRCDDPSSVVSSLERYGFKVVDVHGNSETTPAIGIDRLLNLQALINV